MSEHNMLLFLLLPLVVFLSLLFFSVSGCVSFTTHRPQERHGCRTALKERQRGVRAMKGTAELALLSTGLVMS